MIAVELSVQEIRKRMYRPVLEAIEAGMSECEIIDLAKRLIRQQEGAQQS